MEVRSHTQFQGLHTNRCRSRSAGLAPLIHLGDVCQNCHRVRPETNENTSEVRIQCGTDEECVVNPAIDEVNTLEYAGSITICTYFFLSELLPGNYSNYDVKVRVWSKITYLGQFLFKILFFQQ